MDHSLVDTLAIYGANYLHIFLLLVASIWFLKQVWEAKKEMAAWGVVALPIMYILLFIAGLVYYDPRPFVVGHFTPLIPHDASNGFPSDHTLLCAATSSIVFFYNKKMSAVLWVLTVLVGASRVYVGVHHPLDIIASVIIAVVVSIFAWKFAVPALKKWSLYSNLP